MARIGAALLLLAAAIAASRGLPWWGCDLACAGTAAWSQPFGFEVAWLAAGLLAAAGALALSGRTRAAGTVLAGVAGAGALVYLGLAWSLGLACDHCLATHVPTLLGTALLFAAAPARTAAGMVLTGLAAGALLAARLHQLAPEPEPPPATATTADLAAAVERGRTWPGAGPRIEVGLDPHCPRCAALAGELAALPARPTVRFVAGDAPGRELAAILTAAAADGPGALRTWMGLVLGAAPGTTWADLRPRVAEVLDPAAAESRAASVAAIVAADRARIAGLLGRDPARPLPTPVVAIERPDGGWTVLRGATPDTVRTALGR